MIRRDGDKWVPEDPNEPLTEGLKMACAVFTWIEQFFKIRDKKGRIVPMRLNRVQEVLAREVATQWHRGLPVYFLVLKGRQMGISTFVQALFFALCELMPGYRVAVVAHDEAGAKEVISRSQTALRLLRKDPTWAAPTLLAEQGGYLLWESESSLQAATIKTGDAVGRGGTVSGIHFSESAFFQSRGVNAKRAVTAIMNSLAETRWAVVVHESTPRGKDKFFWPKCEEATDPTSMSSFRMVFFPWYLDPTYQMSWAEYRRVLVSSGKDDPGEKFQPTPEEISLRREISNTKVKEGERLWRWAVSLSDEQLIWRRWALQVKCEGDEELFRQEYPSTYEEAFRSSEECFFTHDQIEHYRTRAEEPEDVGDLVVTPNGALLRRDEKGKVKVWEYPHDDHEYVIGADTGGDGARSDPYCAYVVDKVTLRVVAMIHGHFEWDTFADDLYLLGTYYNFARILVENNHRPAVAKRLHRAGYPNLFYHFEQGVARERAGKRPGYSMNQRTRKEVLASLRRFIRTLEVQNPDPGFWEEMKDFVWVPRVGAANPAPGFDGTYKAPRGRHDDRIMSLGMALTQCENVSRGPRDGDFSTSEQVEDSRAYQWFRRFEQMEREEAARRPFRLGVIDG